MNLVRLILGIIIIALSTYNLITKDFTYMPYLMLLLGVFMLINGLTELRKNSRNLWGYVHIIVFVFLFLTFLMLA